ncbi:unnamed protein product [Ectocarpus sp. 4 AP-2014]
MGVSKVVCMGLLAEVARSQGLQTCSFAMSTCTVRSTEDAATLAASLQSSNGGFSVQWDGEVFVSETIRVTNDTSLNITGAGPSAIADGQNTTQLFYVDGGSSLHLSDMTLLNGRYSDGGAIYAEQSSVSFGGNVSFISNSASNYGGAIFANFSTLSWDGDGTLFSSNRADVHGGAIFAIASTVSWYSDGTHFRNNSAD